MRVIFALLPRTEVLDFAGPLQVFHEANEQGADYETGLHAASSELLIGQGLWLGRLLPLPEPRADDLVLVPGGPVATKGAVPASLFAWLKCAWRTGAHVGSVCTGAFVLGGAGLLDGRDCTTHWSRHDDLARLFPKARVLRNRLFVSDRRVTTSAGIASGIDMALALVEARHGARAASLVARAMVVYLRRDGSHPQGSVALEYRGHLNEGVHKTQDWLTAHPHKRVTLAQLAREAAMSTRSLTRQFRESTGLSVHEFSTRVRLERARDLLKSPELSLSTVAARCGFADARQLRRLWQAAYIEPLSAGRGDLTKRPPESAPLR